MDRQLLPGRLIKGEVLGGVWMDNQSFTVTKIGKMIDHFQVVDEPETCLLVPQAKCHQAGKSFAFKLFFCSFM